jgi:hypothetical protein
MELPDSFDLRLADRPAIVEIQRAIADSDLATLVALSEQALVRLRDPAFRRWPGRMASLDWCEAYQGALSYFVDAARSGGETVSDYIDATGAPLLAGIGAPFFQTDYALLVRGGEWTEWIATRQLTDERTRVRIFRLLREAPPWLEVKIEVGDPCSFVSLGFLDGGILETITANDRPALEQLLSAARPIRHGYADLSWVVPAAWLQDLQTIVDKYAPTRVNPWAEHLQLLHREAQLRQHDILIGGWFGQSSALAPVDWQRIEP